MSACSLGKRQELAEKDCLGKCKGPVPFASWTCGVNAALSGVADFSLTLVMVRDEVKSASCSEWKTPHEGLPLTHRARGAESGRVNTFHTSFMLFVHEKSSELRILER